MPNILIQVDRTTTESIYPIKKFKKLNFYEPNIWKIQIFFVILHADCVLLNRRQS